MLKYHPNGKLYHLYGVIVHKGTAGQGHYIAFIKHQQSWYEMNDRKTMKVAEEFVLKQVAYMLLYDMKADETKFILDPELKFRKRKAE